MLDYQSRASEIFEKGSKTFFNATKFFPEHVRRDVTILYAFVRVADQFVDEQPQRPLDFEVFCAELEHARQGRAVENQIVAHFAELEARYAFPRAWTDAFLESMRMDLTKNTYYSFGEVQAYCYGSASVIGLFIAAIIGAPAESYPHAESLGTAFQLINFIRDIEEDRTVLNRTYIPQDEIEQCQLASLKLEDTRKNPEGFRTLLAIQIERYQRMQKFGLEGIDYLPRAVRAAIMTAADMYDWTGKEILKNPYIIYNKKVKPSKLRILLTGLKNAWYVRTHQEKTEHEVFSK